MADYTVGLSAETILTAKDLEPIAGVVVCVGQNQDGTALVYQAPSPFPSSGRILEIDNPWGTQAVANALWTQLGGYVHRPYEANNVFLDPAAELGATVSIGGVDRLLEQQTVTFDALCTSDIAATGADETGSETEFADYVPRAERQMMRLNTITTNLSVEVGDIRAYVDDEIDDVHSEIEVAVGDVLAEVRGTYAEEWETGKLYYVGDIVKVTDSSGDVETVSFYRCSQQHTSSSSKKPPAASYWTAMQDPPSVSAIVNLNLQGITISYNNTDVSGANSSYITLTKDGVQIGGGTIQMTNVTATTISAEAMSTITLDASQITSGKLAANRISTHDISASRLIGGDVSITGQEFKGEWETGYRYRIDDVVSWTPPSNAGVYYYTCTANHNSSADTEPRVGDNWTNYWTYLGYDEAGQTPDTYNDHIERGYIFTSRVSSSGDYTVWLASNAAMRLKAYDGDLFMQGTNVTLCCDTGSVISSYGDFVPQDDDTYDLGGRWLRWNDVYQMNSSCNTSDRELKKDIEYNPERFDQFFDGLRPCTFRFKNGHERVHMGLIAQDVEELIEECGLTTMDVAAFVKSPKEDGSEGYSYALRYGELIPLLIYEVQQLKREVFGNGSERTAETAGNS